MKAWEKPDIWELDAKNTACKTTPTPTPTPKPCSNGKNDDKPGGHHGGVVYPPGGGGFRLC